MDLITRLKAERDGQVHGGIYDITQKRFAYNSNKIEGSRLTEEQTSFIYETKTIANIGGVGIKIDDLVETTNHFKCFDYVLDSVDEPLTEEYILKLHRMLKSGTSSENNPIAPVEHTEDEMFSLLLAYGLKEAKDLSFLANFHAQFERIHPFADGNGRVGRLILYKECLKEGITPFIVDDLNKSSYYSALEEFQIYDNRQPLLEYFKAEQKFYTNYLKNKGFQGKINDRVNGDVIKKHDPFQEKLKKYQKQVSESISDKKRNSKENDLYL
ncbi:Fic family protein [Streptococcus iniae]|uniref:Fic family protein n=1 Tax=Streptococcus iniae TaxID=1346 RepID=UPI001CD4ED4D|nr:Fic family protein [Streptococcus iniae]MCA1357317.1 Fic family protein [Streptococcus iniae]